MRAVPFPSACRLPRLVLYFRSPASLLEPRWMALSLGISILVYPGAETRERTAGGATGGKTETPREDSMDILKQGEAQ